MSSQESWVDLASAKLDGLVKHLENCGEWADINICNTCATAVDYRKLRSQEQLSAGRDDMSKILLMSLPRLHLVSSYVCEACFNLYSRDPANTHRVLTDGDLELLKHYCNGAPEEQVERKKFFDQALIWRG